MMIIHRLWKAIVRLLVHSKLSNSYGNGTFVPRETLDATSETNRPSNEMQQMWRAAQSNRAAVLQKVPRSIHEGMAQDSKPKGAAMPTNKEIADAFYGRSSSLSAARKTITEDARGLNIMPTEVIEISITNDLGIKESFTVTPSQAEEFGELLGKLARKELCDGFKPTYVGFS